MPAALKVGTQLLVSPHVRDRARALAIVRGEKVAEVYRVALEGAGLAELEMRHAEEIARLHAALNAMKVDKSMAIAAMTEHRMSVDDLYTEAGSPRRRFPAALS